MAKTMTQEIRGLGKTVASLTATGLGAFTLGHGLVSGVSRMKGDASRIPSAVLYDYTGYNSETGGFNSAQTMKSATIIGVGALAVLAMRKLSKRF